MYLYGTITLFCILRFMFANIYNNVSTHAARPAVASKQSSHTPHYSYVMYLYVLSMYNVYTKNSEIHFTDYFNCKIKKNP